MSDTAAPPDISIRAKPPSPRRLSKNVLLAGVTVLAVIVVAALALGLSPTRRDRAAGEARESAASGPPQTIEDAPTQYEIGNLAQSPEEPALQELTPPADPAWTSATQAPQPTAARTVDPAETARAAPILFADVSGTSASNSARATTLGRHGAFVAGQGTSDDHLSAVLRPPRSAYEILAGSVIPAALVTELNSDLPGRVIAQVTAPVFDSVTGRHLLIPQGSRLIGAYDAEVGYGDQRLLLVWNRLILPNGWSIDLQAMEGADPSGAAGLHDRVDNHIGRLASAIGLSAIVSVIADRSEDGDDESLTQSVGDAAAQQAAQSGGRIVDRELDVRPTLRVRIGAPVRVLVMRDIGLHPYER